MLLIKGEPADATGSRLKLYATEPVRLLVIHLYDLISEHPTKPSFTELHISMQKALLPNFAEALARTAAGEDWAKAAEDGEEFLHLEEFAVFIFEIASLWTTPNLYSQLVFLGALYLAVSENNRVKEINTKDFSLVNLLPHPFPTEIKSKKPQPQGLNAIDEIVSAARKQVFEITRDVRAALIFTRGNQPPPQSVMHQSEFNSLISVEIPEPQANPPPFKARPVPNFLRPESPKDPFVIKLEKAARDHIRNSLVGFYTLPATAAGLGRAKLRAQKISDDTEDSAEESNQPEVPSTERLAQILRLAKKRTSRRRKNAKRSS